jgi:oligosaccharide repeat unit polymerase
MAIAALIYFLGSVAHPVNKIVIIKTLMVLGLALVPAFLLGFRSLLLLPVLQFIIVWNYGYRKIPAKGIILAFIFIIVSFTAYGISREIPSGVAVKPSLFVEAALQNPELIYTVVSRSKGTEVVAAVINKLDQTGDYELGWRSLFETITIIVPKKLWEDKPQAASVRFTTYFFADDLRFSRGYDAGEWGGISPTIVGEFYWHFGWFGVTFGLYLMGRLAKVLYCTVQQYRNNRSVLVIYAVVFTSFAMFAEAVQGYANSLVMYGIVIFSTLLILTIRLVPRQSELARAGPGNSDR